MNTVRPVRTVLPLATFGLLIFSGMLYAGPLNPPAGPVAPTYKTLNEVEPRTAINAANTPGDADSLFKITQPGSYYLTGNITGVAGKHGIEIVASGVTLDLNGFDMVGVAGSLDGVTATVASLTNIAVVNGSVRNWSVEGVDLAQQSVRNCRVEGILASGNANTGISAGIGAMVTNCSSGANSGSGIFVSTGSIVADCTARANVLDGIVCGSGSLIRGNTCSGNGSGAGDGAGIHAIGIDTRIEGNNCTTADRGIAVDSSGNIIFGNTCSGNTTNWVIQVNNYYCPIIDRTGIVTAGVNGAAAVGTLATTDPHANFSY